MRNVRSDVLIVGGGLGGVAGALAALKLGANVVLTEETDWLGGQLTAQGVPPDEHRWIERTGCSGSYRQLRDAIRAYYRRNYPLLPASRADPALNPGRGFVSALCSEPQVNVRVLEDFLQPYESRGQLRVLRGAKPIAVEVDADAIRSVSFTADDPDDSFTAEARYILDATELGDLLALGRVEHVTGAESAVETGELHALDGPADPLDQQSITWCFAADYIEGGDFVGEKPAMYDFWKTYQAPFWPGPQLGWDVIQGVGLRTRRRALFKGPRDAEGLDDLWHTRRLLSNTHFPPGFLPSDIVLFNWTAMNYWLRPLVGVEPAAAEQALSEARQLSLSILHWMQTEAPRHDGGQGYPGLRPRPDVLGTSDGLAKMPYVRESRRIKAEFTILEQHVGVAARPGAHGAEEFADSVGVGAYRIDLHPSTSFRNFVDIDSWPFEIPLGALIPVRVDNLLAASKNIGTTHVTNGCYRLHPVEWNIGEAAGALAAFCVREGVEPRQVRNTETLREDFQRVLAGTLGIQLSWPRFGALDESHYFAYPLDDKPLI